MLGILLALQFNTQKQPDVKPNLELQQVLARAYTDLGPVRFGTRISLSGSRPNSWTATALLDTVFIDKRNFKIERRDLMQDWQGSIHAAAGVLWAVNGEISLWSSSDDGQRTTLTKLDSLRPGNGFGSAPDRQDMSAPGFGKTEFGVDDFLCTYAHRALFGELGWLTTAWTGGPSDREWKMNAMTPTRKIQLDYNKQIVSESAERPPWNEPGTDGWFMTVTHRPIETCPDAAKLIQFTPPRR